MNKELLTPQLLENQLERLARLQGADPGIFVLAVHAFVEAYCRRYLTNVDPEGKGFSDWIEELRKELVSTANRFLPELNVLNNLKAMRFMVNSVRHEFKPMTVLNAQIATQQLYQFCKLVGLEGGHSLQRVLDYNEVWKERKAKGELVQSLKDLGFALTTAVNRSNELTQQVARLTELEAEKDSLVTQTLGLEVQLKELTKTKHDKNQRIDELRQERALLNQKLNETRKQLDSLDDTKAYLRTLEYMTVFTRTRGAYEKLVTRLTSEQVAVLDQISLQKDFLIKGAAGTGKTLVLLKAIEKAKGKTTQSSLPLLELSGSVLLLTYTKTLAKYASYMASLVDPEAGDRISTADSFIVEKFRELYPSAGVSYDITKEIAGSLSEPPLDTKLLVAEAESFIWANFITKEEYIDQMVERTGMKNSLRKEQRVQVWKAVTAMEQTMREKGLWAPNLAACELARNATKLPEASRLDYVFVDEAQDLSAAALSALKAIAKKCVVLAGDADQSIYQPFFSFRRAGIDIAGRTRVLRINFRNTVQVHEFAERFRKKSQGFDTESSPEAFREGPEPEVFQGESPAEIQALLAQRVDLFVQRLGYDPENIAIVATTTGDLDSLAQLLNKKGYATANVKDKDFDFSQRGSLRLSTMHSVKGLDFPVVLVYLTRLFGSDTLDQSVVEKHLRNVIYVAVTRAMEHCNIFVKKGSTNQLVVDLIEALTPSASL
ncbi:MAG: AAA family ATPase [Spirochaetales bacterium]|nr:AAA family ATPase [Spirochaetales bacterium]